MDDVGNRYHEAPLCGDDEDCKTVSGQHILKGGIAAICVSCFLLLVTIAAQGSGDTSDFVNGQKGSTGRLIGGSFVVLNLEGENETLELKTRKEKALEEKQAGNVAYKTKDFGEAVKRYEAALALDDTDISFLSNLAAVHFERGEWDECIKRCDEAISKGRELLSDFKLIARAMTRKGSAMLQKGDLEDALVVFKNSLIEHRNADTLAKVAEAEAMLKKKREDDYIDLEKCSEAKEKGNAFFGEHKFPEAVKEYTEAIKRGPPKVNSECYKLYCNRAACYTKLLSPYEAKKDADKCIELKPDFAKGYSRKGLAQYYLREYDKAIETYQKGLSIDPANAELKQGLQSCFNKIDQGNAGMLSEAEQKERRQKAYADPEIQGILKDPLMMQVLRELQDDPQDKSGYLDNPDIVAKIEKLSAAGIVRIGPR